MTLMLENLRTVCQNHGTGYGMTTATVQCPGSRDNVYCLAPGLLKEGKNPKREGCLPKGCMAGAVALSNQVPVRMLGKEALKQIFSSYLKSCLGRVKPNIKVQTKRSIGQISLL